MFTFFNILAFDFRSCNYDNDNDNIVFDHTQ